jgi:hypothetical protein
MCLHERLLLLPPQRLRRRRLQRRRRRRRRRLLCHLVTDTIAAFTYKAIRAEAQPSQIRQLSIVSSSDRPKKCRLFHCQ